MTRSGISSSILGGSFFFFSVASFSIKSGMAAYLLLGLSALHSWRVKLGARVSLLWLVFLLGGCLYLTLQTLLAEEIYSIYLVKFFLFVTYISVIVFAYYNRWLGLRELDVAVKAYLLLHVCSFIVQLILYLSIGYYIDFNNMLREEYSNTAYMSKDVVGLLIPIRATGVFSEPSFFAMNVLPLAAYLHYRNRFPFVVAVGVLCCFLSLSAAAIIITLLWLTSLFWGQLNRKHLVLVPAILSAAVVAGSVAYTRVFESRDYDAMGARLRFVEELELRSTTRNVFGAGFFYNEFGGNGESGLTAAGIRDSGVYVMLLYSGGILGLLTFILLLMYWFGLGRILLGVMVVCLFKYGFLISTFWLFMALFVMTRKSLDARGVKIIKGARVE